MHTAKKTEIIQTDDEENDKVYEIRCFADIIENNRLDAYQELKLLGRKVLAITESVRKANGIVFPNDR
ncbi:hypothetical protein QS257_05100 [Terrilactibacillus sp. S3-3]|nr:hypothetical protein QS257_05100 [Terrilactibacillus sp. S3-3]